MNDEKIDFVLTWVDGDDINWINQKAKYTSDSNVDDSIKRYRDWGLLKYWFRGVEQYAPWVNKIFFITAGHVPIWLNLNHPKIEFVKHEDFIPEDYLPTFNSHTIELNFHRIGKLSEQFVYFNDDIFLINPVKKNDFFSNGLPCDMALLRPIPTDKPSQFQHILLNTVSLLNVKFDFKTSITTNYEKWINNNYPIEYNARNIMFLNMFEYFPGFVDYHLPANLLKSTLNDVWEQFYDYLHTTSMRKFRHYKDINQYIFRYWQLASGNFYPINIEGIGKYYSIPRDLQTVLLELNERNFKMICINDSDDYLDISEISNQIAAEFEKFFPYKSSFEK